MFQPVNLELVQQYVELAIIRLFVSVNLIAVPIAIPVAIPIATTIATTI
jgi:hypothetical protein